MAEARGKFPVLLTPDTIYDELGVIVKALKDIHDKLGDPNNRVPGVDVDSTQVEHSAYITMLAGAFSYNAEKLQNLARHVSGDLG